MHRDRGREHQQRHTKHDAKDYERGRNLFFVPDVLSNAPSQRDQAECEEGTDHKVNTDERLIVILCRHPLKPRSIRHGESLLS